MNNVREQIGIQWMNGTGIVEDIDALVPKLRVGTLLHYGTEGAQIPFNVRTRSRDNSE